MIQAHYFRRLASMATACKRSLALALLAMLLMAAFLAILPILIQYILHAVFILGDEAQMQTALLSVIVVLVLYNAAGFCGRFWMRKVNDQLGMQLNRVLFDKLLHLSARQCHALQNRMAIDEAVSAISAISWESTQIATVLMRDTLAVLGLLVCLTYLNRDFALLAGILVPFIFLMLQVISEPPARYAGNSLHNNGCKPAHLHAKLAAHLRRCIENFKQIRLFGGQQQETQRLNAEVQAQFEHDSQQDNYKAFVVLLCQLLVCLIVVAISYLTLQQVIEDRFGLDQGGMLIAVALLLIMPVKRLAELSHRLEPVQQQLQHLFGLFDLHVVPSPVDNESPAALTETQGVLELQRVAMPPVKGFAAQRFGELNLKIEARETIALVVEDREIRTWLTDMLLGFCTPVAGKLMLDGRDYSTIAHADLLRQFAVITPEPVILGERVANNIAYGDTGCTNEARIMQTIQNTQVARFVREMPEGLQTRIDESGGSLTHRQWQLIAIARALLKNPPVLVVNTLWPQNERESADDVFKALIQVMQQRTTVLLLPAVPACREGIHRLLVYQDGALVGVGTGEG